VIVELSGSGWRLGASQRHSAAITLSHVRQKDRETELRRWLSHFPPESYYVLLLVKPSGQPVLEEIDTLCRAIGFGIGLDLIPEHSSALIGGSFERP
jgi:hypothetical protein